MSIPPQRRRRAVNAHFLTQRGFDQEKIALLFEISHDAVRSDLQLVETHWSELAAALADDLLLQSLQLLQSRLILALKHDPVEHNADRLTPVDYLRARDARETQFNGLAREIRRTAPGRPSPSRTASRPARVVRGGTAGTCRNHPGIEQN